MLKLVFTDLDGTLLDHNTYSWDAAVPAMTALRERSIPLIFVTSKTRAEVEFWRKRLDNHHPFIVENGAAAYIPDGYFPFPVAASGRFAYHVLEWGTPYADLVADLRRASDASRCAVTAFHELTVEDVANLCQMPFEQAALASQREYDEPFLVIDEERTPALLAAIESYGRCWTRGGRFWHILGKNDKALAVQAVTALFERTYGEVATIGLGDSLNDVSFLQATSIPIVIRSPQSQALAARISGSTVTQMTGPEGWNQAILSLLG